MKGMIFEGKTIWITGASSGIGEALALEWSTYKTRIIISGRNIGNLKRVAAECRENGSECLVVPLDLTDSGSIKKGAKEVIDNYDQVDILVNNGGISQRSYAFETSVEVDRKIMETNFFGAITLTKEVLPHMMKRKSGHIIVISSVVGKFGFPMRTAYSASKHALQGYFDGLRAELTDYNIGVTIVSPGRIRTNISYNALNNTGGKHGVMDPGQAKGISSKKCARIIVSAVKRRKKDVIIARSEKVMIFLRKFLPWGYYRLASTVSPT